MRENSRKMKSPLWIYLFMEYPRNTNKVDIIEDLADTGISISETDI